MLAARKVPATAWDDIVSSGDIALDHVDGSAGFKRCYCIGPQDRDQALFSALRARSVPLAEAEAIICTGLNDDRHETPDDYGPFSRRRWRSGCRSFAQSRSRRRRRRNASTIAPARSQISTRTWAATFTGPAKPYLNTYETAHQKAEALRNANVQRDKILVIGDALRTDMKGAETLRLRRALHCFRHPSP